MYNRHFSLTFSFLLRYCCCNVVTLGQTSVSECNSLIEVGLLQVQGTAYIIHCMIKTSKHLLTFPADISLLITVTERKMPLTHENFLFVICS